MPDLRYLGLVFHQYQVKLVSLGNLIKIEMKARKVRYFSIFYFFGEYLNITSQKQVQRCKITQIQF